MLLEVRRKLLGHWAEFYAVTSPNTFVGVAHGESWRDSTARPWNLEARVTPVELLIDSAVSLLLNLEAAQQGRSVLFSDEQKLRLEYQIEFYELLTKPRMKAI
jgi:hypothetical protein